MDPSLTLNFILFLLFIFLAAFFLGLKTAFFSLNNSTLESFAEDEHLSKKQIVKFLQNPKRLILSLQTGNILSNAIAVIISCSYWNAIISQNGVSTAGYIVGISVYFLFTFTIGEILSSYLGSKNPKVYTKFSIYPLLVLHYIFTPVVLLLEMLAKIVSNLLGLDKDKMYLSEKELRNIVDVSEEGAILGKDEKDMIQGIFDMSETVAREIMVPRTDLVCVEKNISLTQLLKLNKEKNHSRIPVYEETIDNIIGIIHIKDLLPLIKKRSTADFDITKLVNEAFFVPEQKKVNELLRELRTERVHMAIIVDEYGGTSGIVTLEDVIEEIVGEIQDEYDKESPQINKIDENVYLVSGSILIDDLNEELQITIPEEEGIDTLAGFLLGQFGSVPKTKSSTIWKDYNFIIERVYNRRIERVRITKQETEKSTS